MNDLDIHNPDNRKAIQEVLKQGANSQFWQIISQRLQESIDALESQRDSDILENLVAEEYKIRAEVMRKQKIDRRDILTMPEDLVRELDNPDFFARKREEEVYKEPKDFE